MNLLAWTAKMEIYFSWSRTLFPPCTTWNIHRWTQRTTKVLSSVSYPPSPYQLHTIVKLCTAPWQCSQLLVLAPIPKADKDCSLQYFHHRQKHLPLTTDTKQIRTPQHYTHIPSQFLHALSCTELDRQPRSPKNLHTRLSSVSLRLTTLKWHV